MSAERLSELRIVLVPDGLGRVSLTIEEHRPSTTEGVTVYTLFDNVVPPATIAEFVRFHVDAARQSGDL